jgi:hypothetical protein
MDRESERKYQWGDISVFMVRDDDAPNNICLWNEREKTEGRKSPHLTHKLQTSSMIQQKKQSMTGYLMHIQKDRVLRQKISTNSCF